MGVSAPFGPYFERTSYDFAVRISKSSKPLPEPFLVYVCVERDGKRYLKGTDMVADYVLPGGTRILIRKEPDAEP